MNNENEMHWTELWPILFRFPLAEDQAKHLRSWLTGEFGVINNAEMCAALDNISERARKAGKARSIDPPTGPQIKSAIIAARAERRMDTGGSPIRWRNPDTRRLQRATVGWVRNALYEQPDPEERWEIICAVMEPGVGDPIKTELLAYAEGLPGGVERYKPDGGAYAGPRAAVGQAFDARDVAPAPAVTGAGYMPGRVSDEEGGWL